MRLDGLVSEELDEFVGGVVDAGEETVGRGRRAVFSADEGADTGTKRAGYCMLGAILNKIGDGQTY